MDRRRTLVWRFLFHRGKLAAGERARSASRRREELRRRDGVAIDESIDLARQNHGANLTERVRQIDAAAPHRRTGRI